MENNGVIISLGEVDASGVRDGRSYVEINDGGKFPSRFVFSDSDRKARGNHVKKLKLQKGQTVIAIGARRRFNEIIGWEIFREQGVVHNGGEIAVIGTLKRKITGKRNIIIVRIAGRDYQFFGSTPCELNRKVAVAARFTGCELPEATAIREVKEVEYG